MCSAWTILERLGRRKTILQGGIVDIIRMQRQMSCLVLLADPSKVRTTCHHFWQFLTLAWYSPATRRFGWGGRATSARRQWHRFWRRQSRGRNVPRHKLEELQSLHYCCVSRSECQRERCQERPQVITTRPPSFPPTWPQSTLHPISERVLDDHDPSLEHTM